MNFPDPQQPATDGGTFFEAVRERIAALPTGALLPWGEATAATDRPFSMQWAAVSAPRIQAEPEGSGRVWLVADSREHLGAHHVPELTIRAEPDLDVYSVWDPERKREAMWRVVAAGASVDAGAMHLLDEAARRHGVEMSLTPGWSVDHVSALLGAWMARVCGRADIRLRHDPGIPRLGDAPAHARAMGFTTMADFVAAVRVGRGDIDVGCRAMRTRDRAATVERMLSARGA
jgi:hypothetical protein